MQEVDSQALGSVAKVLQLSTRGAQVTDFDDAQLQQVLSVEKLVRRALAPGTGGGLFGGKVQNVHAGAGSLTKSIDFYGLVSGTTVAAWCPGPVTDRYDIWLLGPLWASPTVPANINGTLVSIGYPGSLAAQFDVIGAVDVPIVYTGAGVAGAALYYCPEIGSGLPYARGAWRIPRGATVDFLSSATGAAGVQWSFTVGYFPAGLGQDALGEG